MWDVARQWAGWTGRAARSHLEANGGIVDLRRPQVHSNVWKSPYCAAGRASSGTSKRLASTELGKIEVY